MTSLAPVQTSSFDQTIHRLAAWMLRNWVWMAVFFLGLWNLLPWLAPVFMRLGWEAPAQAIYVIYQFFCHQLPQRSWFLFGPQFTYTKNEILMAMNGNADPGIPRTMRVFIGAPEMGWKLGWSDRMVSFYGGWFVAALVYALVRKRWQGLS